VYEFWNTYNVGFEHDGKTYHLVPCEDLEEASDYCAADVKQKLESKKLRNGKLVVGAFDDSTRLCTSAHYANEPSSFESPNTAMGGVTLGPGVKPNKDGVICFLVQAELHAVVEIEPMTEIVWCYGDGYDRRSLYAASACCKQQLEAQQM
jgi:hypothetical protein